MIISLLGLNIEGAKSDTVTAVSHSESYFNSWLSKQLKGEVEKKYYFITPTGEKGYVFVDIDTDEYVIEGGLDKRSSLDSLQQALFASVISKKKAAVAIYDTDGFWGKIEHRIFTAAKRAKIKFFWISNGRFSEK